MLRMSLACACTLTIVSTGAMSGGNTKPAAAQSMPSGARAAHAVQLLIDKAAATCPKSDPFAEDGAVLRANPNLFDGGAPITLHIKPTTSPDVKYVSAGVYVGGVSYDKDSQRLLATIPFKKTGTVDAFDLTDNSVVTQSDYDIPGIDVLISVSDPASFIGSNAFGVRAKIFKVTKRTWGFAFLEPDDRAALGMYASADQLLPEDVAHVAPDVARATAAALDWEVVLQPVVYSKAKCGAHEQVFVDEATISDPYEVRKVTRYAAAKIISVRLFDSRNAQVLWTLPLAGVGK